MNAQSRRTRPSSNTIKLLALLAMMSAVPALAGADPAPAQPSRVPKVQIAILLDNSGSMEGLINQARSQIWKLVNTFATAKRGGQRPRLELALYEYGDGVVRLSPFTNNLDKISEMLFSLGIRGGDEYCGQVIQNATRELEWSGNPDDLKLIYIAGNEPFTQGPVDFHTAIAQAKRKGITVNVIHCGGDEPTWRQGAVAAGGDYFMINQNATVATINAPQDAEIAALGAKLNSTYVGYGHQAKEAAVAQEAQDTNAAAAAPSVAAERAVSKASAMYDNSGWDIVDARKAGKKLEAMKDDELPAEM